MRIRQRDVLIWGAGFLLALLIGFIAAWTVQPTLSKIWEDKPVPVHLRGKLQEPVFPPELNYLTHCDPQFQPSCQST